MASLDILCINLFNLKNKIMKIEHRKIFRGPSKILKNISWPINICIKYFTTPQKPSAPHPHPSYILSVQSLKNVWKLMISQVVLMIDINQVNKQDSKHQCYDQICVILVMHILLLKEILLLQRMQRAILLM